MKKNFDFNMTDIDGNILKENDKIVTARMIVVAALLAAEREETAGEEKARRYDLALSINKGGEQDLKSEDIALLKKLIGKGYSPLVVGPLYKFLDE